MKIYLAISSDAPRRWSPDQLDPRLRDVVMPREGAPWRSDTWLAPDRCTALLGWTNEPDDPRVLPLIHTDGHRVAGCPGYLGDRGDARRLLEAGDPGRLADELVGAFALFRAEPGGFDAVTTVVRLHCVFHGQAGATVVASNRALLVWAALAALREVPPSPVYDMIGMQALVRNGYFLADQTPFEGVRALPAHSTLAARRGRARIATRELPDPARRPLSRRARREAVDELVDAMLAAAAPLRAFTGPVVASLTGGRDSRLVAAILHASKIPFRTTTNGLPTHPDVVLAARIAALLGVDHAVTVPRQRDGDLVVESPLRRAWHVLRATDGMISAHDTVALPRRFRVSATTSGAGGEQLRAGFVASQAQLRGAGDRDRLRKLFLAFDDYMTESANESARGDLAPWLDRDPLCALDRIYLYQRTGRWSAAARTATTLGHDGFNLLLDGALNRRAVQLSPAWRWTEEPLHLGIRRLAPALADVPLTKRRWRFDVSPPRWPFRRGWRARAPVAVESQGAGFDWRNSAAPALMALFREHILGGPSALFDLVRRPRLEGLLGRSTLNRSQAMFVWHVFTASVLLSGAWLDEAPRAPELQVPIPAAARAAPPSG